MSEQRLAEAIADTHLSPLRYVQLAFGWGEGELTGFPGPDPWQKELLLDIEAKLKADPDAPIFEAVASGHGVGKSAVTAWLILWAMSTRPHLSGVVTANTLPQLSTKTWRELAVWHKRAINAHWFKWTATRFFHVAHPETWFVAAIPNTEHNSESFAGLHARYVLVIYDEASAIPDSIWEVSYGAMTTPGAIWCAFGNPTRNSGAFRRCFGAERSRWAVRQVDARKSALTNKAFLQSLVDEYGEDHDFVRVRVKGEFPRASSTQFIASDKVDAARARQVETRVFSAYPKVLGVDVARFGNDESVIQFRQGPMVFDPRPFAGVDTMQLVSFVAEAYLEHRPAYIAVDGTGVGGGVVDRLRQLPEIKCPIVDVQFGAQARDTKAYANTRTELWGRMRDWLAGEVSLPDYRKLLDDLVAVEYGYNQRMQLQLERKQDMKARGLASPDYGDALAITFADSAATTAARYTPPAPKRWGRAI
jgi:hypothetical protein